jgi:hypothetical protein
MTAAGPPSQTRAGASAEHMCKHSKVWLSRWAVILGCVPDGCQAAHDAPIAYCCSFPPWPTNHTQLPCRPHSLQLGAEGYQHHTSRPVPVGLRHTLRPGQADSAQCGYDHPRLGSGRLIEGQGVSGCVCVTRKVTSLGQHTALVSRHCWQWNSISACRINAAPLKQPAASGALVQPACLRACMHH